MIKRIVYPKDGTARVVFCSDDGDPLGYVVFNEIVKNGKVVDYELINEISFLETAKKMNKTPKEVYSMAKGELDRNNLKIGDKVEFVYSDETNRIGKIADIVTHFSAKLNKTIETFIWIDEDDGTMIYPLSELEEIKILKKVYDSNGREVEIGDFVQFSPVDYKNYVWGKIIFGTDADYAIEVLYPKSMEGKIYSTDGHGVVILSKYSD